MSGVFNPAEAGWQPVDDRRGFVELIGPFWQRGTENGTLFGVLVTKKHCNPGGPADDGVLSTLLDVSLGMASWDSQGSQRQATVSLNVQFIAPVKVGEFVVAESRVVRTELPLVFVQGTLRVDGDIRAVAHGTWKVLNK